MSGRHARAAKRLDRIFGKHMTRLLEPEQRWKKLRELQKRWESQPWPKTRGKRSKL